MGSSPLPVGWNLAFLGHVIAWKVVPLHQNRPIRRHSHVPADVTQPGLHLSRLATQLHRLPEEGQPVAPECNPCDRMTVVIQPPSGRKTPEIPAPLGPTRVYIPPLEMLSTCPCPLPTRSRA